MPIVSAPAPGKPAGLSSGIVYQTGSGSPQGTITPTQKGAVYQDLTNGGVYVAITAVNTGWVAVGGDASNGTVPGVSVHSGTIVLTAAATSLSLTDVPAYVGSGNGIYWNNNGAADGSQTSVIQIGAGGAFLHSWNADGTYTLPAPATAATHAPRLNQLSPKATITSGALPTLAPASGTGLQILTTRDTETTTPFTGDATNNAATCAIALSADNVTYSTLATLSIAAALNLTGALALDAKVRVPAGWWLKLTAVHGTIGTLTYY